MPRDPPVTTATWLLRLICIRASAVSINGSELTRGNGKGQKGQLEPVFLPFPPFAYCLFRFIHRTKNSIPPGAQSGTRYNYAPERKAHPRPVRSVPRLKSADERSSPCGPHVHGGCLAHEHGECHSA